MLHRLLPALALTFATPLAAQDGGQLFTLYCSACHGADGKGATGGAFPPLAGSPWVADDAARSIKLILHGMTGPVEVLGKTYNLEMQPQGAVLPDDSIAAILTYVRSSWGNAAPPVSADLVKQVRAATTGRKTPWTAGEILKLHPFPFEQTALRDLISQVYAGEWIKLPDFTKEKGTNIEEEHDGIISLKDATLDNNFAMVWQATFEAPADGEYSFHLDADDAARVLINGKSTVEVQGIGPMNGSRAKEAKITLTRGPQKFRVEYLEFQGEQSIALGWRGPGVKNWKWLTDTAGEQPLVRDPITIEPTNGRPVIHRNFIDGTTARAIGVGFPGGVNLAWSADHLGPELIWTGMFIDGAIKWTDRGTDKSPPAGENVVQLFKARVLPEASRFKSYTLDSAGNPTFHIEIGPQTLSDSWRAGEGKSLVRTLALTGGTEPMDFLLTNLPTGPALMFEAGSVPVEISEEKAQVKLVPGTPTTVTYRWK